MCLRVLWLQVWELKCGVSVQKLQLARLGNTVSKALQPSKLVQPVCAFEPQRRTKKAALWQNLRKSSMRPNKSKQRDQKWKGHARATKTDLLLWSVGSWGQSGWSRTSRAFSSSALCFASSLFLSCSSSRNWRFDSEWSLLPRLSFMKGSTCEVEVLETKARPIFRDRVMFTLLVKLGANQGGFLTLIFQVGKLPRIHHVFWHWHVINLLIHGTVPLASSQSSKGFTSICVSKQSAGTHRTFTFKTYCDISQGQKDKHPEHQPINPDSFIKKALLSDLLSLESLQLKCYSGPSQLFFQLPSAMDKHRRCGSTTLPNSRPATCKWTSTAWVYALESQTSGICYL